MIDQHLGRRSVSDFQHGVLALRKKDILAGRAQPARISSNTINQIEKIQKSAAPELVAAVKSGTISINVAATVASLPVEAQVRRRGRRQEGAATGRQAGA